MEYSICVDAVLGADINDKTLEELSRIHKEIEFWSWWDRDVEVFARAAEAYNIKIRALCTPFISLVDPSKREEFIEGLQRTVEVCKKLDCRTIIAQVGDELDIPRYKQHDSIVQGLKSCTKLLEENDIVLVVEPLNTVVDHKGYYLYNSAEGFEIVKKVGSQNVKLLYDIYHMQIMEGNILAHMKENLPLIGHVHIAGVPGRHEVLGNELDYTYILSKLETWGYKGAVGLEYFPNKDPLMGLRDFFAVIQERKSMRRKDREVTDINAIREILDKCRTVSVAMVDNGEPYVIPLSYGYELHEDCLTLYLHCAKEGRKITVLKHHPTVSFVIFSEGELTYAGNPCNAGYSYSSVAGKGTVEFVEDTAGKREALANIFAHQTGINVEFTEAQAETVCVLKIIVRDYTGKHKK